MNKQKILVVDDEELIRNVIKEYSLMEGYNVFEAEDGLEAIKMVKEEDLLYGKMPTNDYEIVVDSLTIDKFFESGTPKMAGI